MILGSNSRRSVRRQTLRRRTVPGTWIVHYVGGAKAKAHRERMRGVHRRRLAKRRERRRLAPALHARARVRTPRMVTSMVGSRSSRKYGVYLGTGFLHWFRTKKERRTFITGHPLRIRWKWPTQRDLFGLDYRKRKRRRKR